MNLIKIYVCFVLNIIYAPFGIASFLECLGFLFQTSIFRLLGFKLGGLVQAIVIPLGLTMVLFLGSLSMQGLTGLWHLYTGKDLFIF